VCHLAKILYDHTYKGTIGKRGEIGTGSRNPPPGGVVSNWRLISATDKDIFTKFDVLVVNGVSQHVECFLQTSKMADIFN